MSRCRGSLRGFRIRTFPTVVIVFDERTFWRHNEHFRENFSVDEIYTDTITYQWPKVPFLSWPCKCYQYKIPNLAPVWYSSFGYDESSGRSKNPFSYRLQRVVDSSVSHTAPKY